MKFRPEPWAEAFISAAGSVSAAEEALGNLRVFCRAALTVPGDLSGRSDADRLGRCITAALPAAHGMNPPLFASRFIQLMLRKRRFNQYKEILRAIEKEIDKQKGIEEVIIETAEEPQKEILEAAKEKALRLTGAKDIKLTSRVIPDLIGGIRLRWGSMVFDGSIKWRLEKMAGNISNLSGYFVQEAEA
jgi:hypothetical protein